MYVFIFTEGEVHPIRITRIHCRTVDFPKQVCPITCEFFCEELTFPIRVFNQLISTFRSVPVNASKMSKFFPKLLIIMIITIIIIIIMNIDYE